MLQQIFERTAYQMMMRWMYVRVTWHRMIRFRQSEDIYIQRQLSPRLGKWGGQLISSTSIHYVSIKKNSGDRRTHWHPNCHTGKLYSGTEVHLLLNNQETLISVCKSLSGRCNSPVALIVDCLSLEVFRLSNFELVFDLYVKRQYIAFDRRMQIKSHGFRCMAILARGQTLDWNKPLNQVLHIYFLSFT